VKRRPHRARTRLGNRADQGARWYRGIGQKSVVRISGSSISYASKGVRGATGGSSNESSRAPCDTCAYRYPQGCRSLVRREADRVGRAGVANGCAIRESVGSKPPSLGFDERVSARRTTRRNASRSCFMPPNPRHGVGARFSQVGLAECRRKPMRGAGSCRLHSDPNRAVPARMTMDARDRSSPSEAPPAVPMWAARGVGTGAKSSTGANVPAKRSRHGASVCEVDRSRRV